MIQTSPPFEETALYHQSLATVVAALRADFYQPDGPVLLNALTALSLKLNHQQLGIVCAHAAFEASKPSKQDLN